MGIRFYCPHCSKKLNVKTFLAGKRGICPYCDAGLDIPLDSQINGKVKHPTESVEVQTVDPALAAAEAFAEPLKIGGGSSSTAVDSRDVNQPSDAVSSASSTGEVSSSAVSVDAAPAPSGPDAIDENPEAVWYVRPPSGGQFGPAKGDVMRKWLAEGRVSPDALVWREGWADWKEAEPVFPSLARRSTPPPPPAEAPPAPTSAPQTAVASPSESAGRAVGADAYTSGSETSSTSSTESSRPVARKKSNLPYLILIGVLAVGCIGLLVVFLIVSGVFS